MGKLTSFLIGTAAGAAGALLYWKNKDKIKPVAEEALAKAMSMGENAVEMAGKAKDQVLEMAGKARDGAVDFTSRAKDGVADMATTAKNNISEFANETRADAQEVMENARRIKAEKYDQPEESAPPAGDTPYQTTATVDNGPASDATPQGGNGAPGGYKN